MKYIAFNRQKIRELLEKLSIKPKDYLGQNFLVNNAYARKIVDAADIAHSDTVLEVGPGLGIVTQELAMRAGRVIAVEKDKKLSDYLKKRFDKSNIAIIEDDILAFYSKLTYYGITSYKIVANLPYQISARFLKLFLSEAHVKPQVLVITLQKEVAKKLIARPGSLTKLSLLAELYTQPSILFNISASHFYPTPKIQSTLVKLIVRENLPFIFPQEEIIFWRLVRAGFAAKRKKLVNNLAHGLHVSAESVRKMFILANLRENIRAQELKLSDWLTLVDIYQKIY